jgi:hydroxymethylpyrimidine pyrophosphatase-like HAD family hydrolase
MKDIRPKTIICDIDGTLVKHNSPLLSARPEYKMELLPGTLEKLAEWDIKGYNIILISGRREGARKETERQLAEVGIIYDKLILGVGGGVRVLLNDKKPEGTIETALAYNLIRNTGIKDIEI